MSVRSSLAWLALTACGSGVHSIVPPNNTAAAQATMWQQVRGIPTVDYYAISGVSDPKVIDPVTKKPTLVIFIVGDDGTIIKSDGVKFAPDVSNTTANLHAVHVVSATLAYAAGTDGTILIWDGTTWNLQVTGSADQIDAIWADDKTVFAVGPSGALTLDNGIWIPVPTATSDSLYGVTQVGNKIIAVGALGTVAEYNATLAHEVRNDPTCKNGSAGDATATATTCNGCDSGACNISGQACATDADCYQTPFTCTPLTITGAPYTVTVLVGGVPTDITVTPTETDNQCISAQSFDRNPIGLGYTDTLSRIDNSAAGVFAGGIGGQLFKYNGSSFSEVTPSAAGQTLPDVFIRDAAGPGNGDVWVVGFGGLLARLRNNAYLIFPVLVSPPAAGSVATPPAWLSSVWCEDAAHVFVVGASGTILSGPPPRDPDPNAPIGSSAGAGQ